MKREMPSELIAKFKRGHGSDWALGAKNVRLALKELFPDTRFRVTSKNRSTGSFIDVRWSCGPSVDDVDSYISAFQYGYFDTLTDAYLYVSDNHKFTEMYGGAKYVQCCRTFPDALMVSACLLISARRQAMYKNWSAEQRAMSSLTNVRGLVSFARYALHRSSFEGVPNHIVLDESSKTYRFIASQVAPQV